jgi:hypothetical protein
MGHRWVGAKLIGENRKWMACKKIPLNFMRNWLTPPGIPRNVALYISAELRVFFDYRIFWRFGTKLLFSRWSMKFRESKFREIIVFVFREIFIFTSRNFVSQWNFCNEISLSTWGSNKNLGRSWLQRKCCGAGAGKSRIIFVTIFYIIKWWRHSFPWRNIVYT